MTKPYVIHHLGVMTDYEYTSTHKRERLVLWSGPFFSICEGQAHSLPGGDGYMVTLDPEGTKLRVACPAPRRDDNYEQVDEALRLALNEHFLTIGVVTLDIPTRENKETTMPNLDSTLAPLALPTQVENVGDVVSAVRLVDKPAHSPGFVVIARNDEAPLAPYSTHLVFTHDAGATWVSTMGEYDMSFAEATEDLVDRIKRGI